MQNIRLDFISDIKAEYLERMREIRSEFIELDLLLQEFEDDDNYSPECGVVRSVALARTHLESALQHSIKALCLMGENR